MLVGTRPSSLKAGVCKIHLEIKVSFSYPLYKDIQLYRIAQDQFIKQSIKINVNYTSILINK